MTDQTDEGTQAVHPAKKTPEEIQSDPHEAINPEAVKDMAADPGITEENLKQIESMAMDTSQAKKIWDSVTSGAVHKITACMTHFKGKVNDPGAFCKSLADKSGYKPE